MNQVLTFGKTQTSNSTAHKYLEQGFSLAEHTKIYHPDPELKWGSSLCFFV